MAGIKYASRKALLPSATLLLLGMVSMAASVSAGDAGAARRDPLANVDLAKVPTVRPGSGKPLWATLPASNAGGSGLSGARCRALFGAYCGTCSPGFKTCVSCLDASLTGGVALEPSNGGCTKAKPVNITFDDVATDGGFVTIPSDADYSGLYWSSVSTRSGGEGNAYAVSFDVLNARGWNAKAVVTQPNAITIAGVRDELHVTAPAGKTYYLISLFVSDMFAADAGLSVQVTGFNAAGEQVAQKVTPMRTDQATGVTVDEQAFSDLSKVVVGLVGVYTGDNSIFGDATALTMDSVMVRPSLV